MAFHSMALKWRGWSQVLTNWNDPPLWHGWNLKHTRPKFDEWIAEFNEWRPGGDPKYSNKSWDDPPSGVVCQICSGATGEVFPMTCHQFEVVISYSRRRRFGEFCRKTFGIGGFQFGKQVGETWGGILHKTIESIDHESGAENMKLSIFLFGTFSFRWLIRDYLIEGIIY